MNHHRPHAQCYVRNDDAKMIRNIISETEAHRNQKSESVPQNGTNYSFLPHAVCYFWCL